MTGLHSHGSLVSIETESPKLFVGTHPKAFEFLRVHRYSTWHSFVAEGTGNLLSCKEIFPWQAKHGSNLDKAQPSREQSKNAIFGLKKNSSQSESCTSTEKTISYSHERKVDTNFDLNEMRQHSEADL